MLQPQVSSTASVQSITAPRSVQQILLDRANPEPEVNADTLQSHVIPFRPHPLPTGSNCDTSRPVVLMVGLPESIPQHGTVAICGAMVQTSDLMQRDNGLWKEIRNLTRDEMWKTIEEIVKQGTIVVFPEIPAEESLLPQDFVFTRDIGGSAPNGIRIASSQLGTTERNPELKLHRQLEALFGSHVHSLADDELRSFSADDVRSRQFERTVVEWGDVIVYEGNIYIGVGNRSTMRGIQSLNAIMQKHGYEGKVLPLPMKNWGQTKRAVQGENGPVQVFERREALHLDCAWWPLKNVHISYQRAFANNLSHTVGLRDKKEYRVTEGEQRAYATNGITLKDDLLLTSRISPAMAQLLKRGGMVGFDASTSGVHKFLEQNGYSLVTPDFTALQLLGGSIRCWSNPVTTAASQEEFTRLRALSADALKTAQYHHMETVEDVRAARAASESGNFHYFGNVFEWMHSRRDRDFSQRHSRHALSTGML